MSKIEETKNLIKDKVGRVEFTEYRSKILGTLFIICKFYGKGHQFAHCIARGTSICSLADPFNRKKGKSFAYGRAAKALITEKNTGELRSNIKPNKIKRTVWISNGSTEDTDKRFRQDVFKKIIPHLYKYRPIIKGSKIGFEIVINSLFPLEVASGVIGYKSEYYPTYAPEETSLDKYGVFKEDK